MTDRLQETFSVIIDEVKQTAKGPQVAMKIPAFQSDYPITIADVPPEVVATMKPGDAVNVVLERQNMKKPKSGTYDGSKHWHYYWGWVRYASVVESVKAQETAKVAVASEDRKEVAIRRAVALGRAVDFLKDSGGDIDMVLEVAETFDAWLAAGIVQEMHQGPQIEVPKANPVGDSGITDVTTFWESVMALHPSKDRSEVQKMVLSLFGGNIAEWIKAGNTWAETFEKVKSGR